MVYSNLAIGLLRWFLKRARGSSDKAINVLLTADSITVMDVLRATLRASKAGHLLLHRRLSQKDVVLCRLPTLTSWPA